MTTIGRRRTFNAFVTLFYLFIYLFILFFFGFQKGDVTNTILNLASLSDANYEKLQEVFKNYGDGILKDQTLKPKELSQDKAGPDCKPRHFSNFVKIKDDETQGRLLQELALGNKSLKEFDTESSEIKRCDDVRKQSSVNSKRDYSSEEEEQESSKRLKPDKGMGDQHLERDFIFFNIVIYFSMCI